MLIPAPNIVILLLAATDVVLLTRIRANVGISPYDRKRHADSKLVVPYSNVCLPKIACLKTHIKCVVERVLATNLKSVLMSIYNYKVKYRTGKGINMIAFKGKVMLIVNTASKCGFTPQFEGLEKLNQDYKDKGLQVLGFPCNQFANQDPADDDTIKQFCQTNYGVTFPVFARVLVNGEKAHALFDFLKTSARGIFWTKRVKWNFTKFLVDHEGKVIRRYAPSTKPEKLRDDIEALLAQI